MVELKYRRAVRNNEGQWLDRKIAPINRTELPLILFQPAKDQFPLIEKALLTKYNLKIPDSCKVEHLLAAVSVGLANLIIEDNKLPINTAPNDVFFILDDYDNIGGQYSKITVFVNYSDGNIFYGRLWLPTMDKDSGLPYFFNFTNKSVKNYRATDLLIYGTDDFNEKGMRLLRFLHNTVQNF